MKNKLKCGLFYAIYTMNPHNGLNSSCKDQDCDYEPTQKGNFARHQKRVHSGKKFRCPEQWTMISDLQTYYKSRNLYSIIKMSSIRGLVFIRDILADWANEG